MSPAPPDTRIAEHPSSKLFRTLPVSPRQLHEPASVVYPVSRMVVLVDDYHDSATFMVRPLQRSGLAACCYTSAQEFLAVLAAGGPLPSLLILDNCMPGMDGAGLLRLLMRDDRWREIPVVLYTADPTSDDGDDVHEAMRSAQKARSSARWIGTTCSRRSADSAARRRR
jgi:CheY-like chemotaxis protein